MEIENKTLENLVVSTLEDNNDGDLSAGNLSLREAIAEANPGAIVTFADNLNGSIVLGQGELIINKSLNIDGSGANNLAIDGNRSSRVFLVDDGNGDAFANVSIKGLTIVNADSGSSTDSLNGGGVLNRENLTISNTALIDNFAPNGGAIYNTGQLQLQNSLVNRNNGLTAAIFNTNGGKATISNSTIADNDTAGIGAIASSEGTELTLTNSTITGNDSRDAAVFVGGTANITSTIVAGNSGEFVAGRDDVIGTVTSGGNNLIGNADTSEGFDRSSDLIGTTEKAIDPLLGELQDNGGTTATIALQSGSPAINAGSNPNGLSVDQRGGEFSRTVDTATDIGAFESQTIVPEPPGTSKIVGTRDNDLLSGTEQDDIIKGLDGDDTLQGLGGNDELKGNRGNDSLEGGAGDDTLEGGLGDDFLNGEAGNNVLRGGAGNDRIFGSFGNDNIMGASGNDFIVGLGGDDTIIGGAGDDTIQGGFSGSSQITGRSGRDVFVLADGDSQSVITDFRIGEDRLGLTRFTRLADLTFEGNLVLEGDRIAATLEGVDTTVLTEADFIDF